MTADGWVLNDEGANLALRVVEHWIDAFGALSQTIIFETRRASTNGGTTLLSATSMTIAVDISTVGLAQALRLALLGLWVFGEALLAIAASIASVRMLAYAMASGLIARRGTNLITETVRCAKLQVFREQCLVEVKLPKRSANRYQLELVAPAFGEGASCKLENDGAGIIAMN